METITAFVLGFAFSFAGSIPPGTLNLTIIQLGLEHRMRVAFRFAAAAALIEYPYAWIAVTFQDLIMSPSLTGRLQLVSAAVLVILGAFNLYSAGKVREVRGGFNASGFRRGLLLGILNPMALPFWLGITVYLKTLKLIRLESSAEIHLYLAGITLGAFALLITLAYMARSLKRYFEPGYFVRKIPGVLLIALGLYGFILYFSGG